MLDGVDVVVVEVVETDGLGDALPAGLVIPHVLREGGHEDVQVLAGLVEPVIDILGFLQPGWVGQLDRDLEQVRGEDATLHEPCDRGHPPTDPVAAW